MERVPRVFLPAKVELKMADWKVRPPFILKLPRIDRKRAALGESRHTSRPGFCGAGFLKDLDCGSKNVELSVSDKNLRRDGEPYIRIEEEKSSATRQMCIFKGSLQSFSSLIIVSLPISYKGMLGFSPTFLK